MRVVRDIVRRACVYAATPRARARASRGVARDVCTYVHPWAFSSRCTYVRVDAMGAHTRGLFAHTTSTPTRARPERLRPG